MASDVMRVRLHLRQVRVRAVVVDTAEELRVWVESTVSPLRRPHCGFKCPRVYDVLNHNTTPSAEKFVKIAVT